jgi:predicted nuclease of predicted toxin-antitoxin system
MKYLIDQMLSGLAEELRAKGVECLTVQEALRNSTDSSKGIDDDEIFKHLMDNKGEVCLITLDNDLAKYCARFGIPCVRVQDAVHRDILRGDP